MLKTTLIPVAVAAVLLSGCATLPGRQAAMPETRTYPDSQALIWQRILATSARKSMSIRQADMASGVISTDHEFSTEGSVELLQNSISNWAWCGSGGLLGHTLSQRVELDYNVRKDKDGDTVVTLNGRFRELRIDAPRRPPQWVECQSTGTLERQMLEAIYYDHPV